MDTRNIVIALLLGLVAGWLASLVVRAAMVCSNISSVA